MEEKILLDVEIKAQDALDNYAKLQKRIGELRTEQERLKKAHKENTTEYRANEQAIKALTKQSQEQTKTIQNNINLERMQNGSMQQMKAQLSLLTAEFNNLTRAEREADLAKGRQGMDSYSKQIKDLTDELKAAEMEVGNFHRNVGNYEGAIQNMLGVNSKWFNALKSLGGLFNSTNGAMNQGRAVVQGFGQATQQAGTQMQGASSAMASLNRNANEGRTVIQGFATATTSGGTATQALSAGVTTAGNAVKGFGKQLLALLANPIVAIIAAIAAAFMALTSAIKSDEEATNALQRIMAPFQGLLDVVTAALQKMVTALLLAVEGAEKMAMGLSKMLESLPLVGSAFKEVNTAIENQVEATKAHQRAEEMEREQIIATAENANKVAELRNKVAQKDKYTTEERKKMLEQAIAIEKREAAQQKALAQQKLKALELETAYTKNTAETKRKLAEATAAVTQADTNYLQVTMRLQKQLATFNEEIKREADASAKSAKDAADKAKEKAKQRADAEREAIRKEEDTTIALIVNTYDQRRQQINVQYNRQIEDLRRKLQEEKNLTARAREAINKTIANLESKRTEELTKLGKEETDSLKKTLANLDALISTAEAKKAQSIVDTYTKATEEAKKQIDALQAKVNKGTATGEEKEALYKLYEYTLQLEGHKQKELTNLAREGAQKRIKEAEEAIKNEGAIALAEYSKTEKEKTEILIEQSKKRIALYQEELKATTDEKQRLELQQKIATEEQAIRQNQVKAIQLEEAEALANSAQTAEEKYRIKQEFLEKELEAVRGNADAEREVEAQMVANRQEYVNSLAESIDNFTSKASTMFGNLSAIANNNDKKELTAYKATQEKKKTALQKRLDAGLIEEEEYNAQVQAIDEETAAKELEIEIAQAKREKAMAIISALINTATAIMRIWADVPKMDFGASTIALTAVAAAMGAAQVAAIASQPLPTAGSGMYIQGNDHAHGGVLINAEGGEAIINKKATSRYLPLLSRINQSTGGVPLYGAGGIAGIQSAQAGMEAGIDYDALAAACANVPVYAAVTDINRGQGRVARIVERKTY